MVDHAGNFVSGSPIFVGMRSENISGVNPDAWGNSSMCRPLMSWRHTSSTGRHPVLCTSVGSNRSDSGLLRIVATPPSGSPAMFSSVASFSEAERWRSRSFETSFLCMKRCPATCQHVVAKTRNRPLVVNAVHSSARGLVFSSEAKSPNERRSFRTIHGFTTLSVDSSSLCLKVLY